MQTKTKRWLGILIAVLLLVGGFYLYYFYPQLIPGMAGKSPELEEDIEILFIGLDDRESVEKGEVESDSVILTTIEAGSNKLSFKAIPSDTKIDGQEIKAMKPAVLNDKIENIVGVTPEYYFTLSYDGFKKVINEIGGIKVNLKNDLQINDLGLDLKEGENILSGQEALNYARWYNYEKNEIDRIQRQQKVIEAILDKVLARETLLDIPRLYSTVVESYKSVETNMDQDMISRIIKLARERDNIELDYTIIQKELSQE